MKTLLFLLPVGSMEQQQKAPSEIKNVAQFLRSGSSGLKVRVGALNGKRLDYFKGAKDPYFWWARHTEIIYFWPQANQQSKHFYLPLMPNWKMCQKWPQKQRHLPYFPPQTSSPSTSASSVVALLVPHRLLPKLFKLFKSKHFAQRTTMPGFTRARNGLRMPAASWWL